MKIKIGYLLTIAFERVLKHFRENGEAPQLLARANAIQLANYGLIPYEEIEKAELMMVGENTRQLINVLKYPKIVANGDWEEFLPELNGYPDGHEHKETE